MKKRAFKQCCCFEIQGDNINCPVHYPKFVQFQLLLGIMVTITILVAVIILVVLRMQ